MEKLQIFLLSLGWLFLLGESIVFILFRARFSRTHLRNTIADHEHTVMLLKNKEQELVIANARLAERNQELDELAKILVRRDLDLTESNQRLEDLDVIKSEFVSVAAHQLRTPLTGIKWTIYSLLEEHEYGALNNVQRKIAKDALTSAERLIVLINDLLDVARLEEGRFGFRFHEQDFLPIITEAAKRFFLIAKEQGVKLSFDPQLPLPKVMCDEEKIVVVLENLLDNAIKYTPQGGIVKLRAFQANNFLTIEVQDSGIGIPANQAERVFQKFFRAQNAQLYQTNGTGLGLFLAKNIVEHHKGSISFESAIGKGTTFRVALPLQIN